MSSVICFNFDLSKILSSGNELKGFQDTDCVENILEKGEIALTMFS